MNGRRAPYAAGMFYPGGKEKLRGLLQQLFESVPERKYDEYIPGIVVPHAGYQYSGYTAAAGFSALRGRQYEQIIILSPSHYDDFSGCSIYPGSAYITPLGDVPIDKDLAELLTESSPEVFFSEQGHRKEHGIEVELPFLQHLFGEFSFVPVVMGSQDETSINALAGAIKQSCNPQKCLLVVSSDLSHFYDSKTADLLDSQTASSIENFDDVGLMNKLQTGLAQACGGGLIVTALRVLKENTAAAEVLHRTNSGETSGDFNSVVGYLTAVLHGKKASL